jgi:polar amino acid transport system substrate-binding protein
MTRRLCLAAVLALAVAAVAVQASAAASRHAAGKSLVFCSDVSYPPEEFAVNGKTVGSDIDIAAQVAKRLGMTSQIVNTGFDGIIAALLSNKCDAVISGMNDTPERAKAVAFIDYLTIGQSFIGKKGNPLHVTTALDVCGKVAGAQVATTNLQTLQALDKKCKAQGKKGISITPFKEDPLGVTALKTGKLDIYESDGPPAVWYTTKDPSLQIVGPPVAALPVGIAVNPKNTALKAKIQQAINGMYKDGTMKRILVKWKMAQFALKGK